MPDYHKFQRDLLLNESFELTIEQKLTKLIENLESLSPTTRRDAHNVQQSLYYAKQIKRELRQKERASEEI